MHYSEFREEDTNFLFIHKNAFGPLSLSLIDSVKMYLNIYLDKTDEETAAYLIILIFSCKNKFRNFEIYYI